MVDNYRTPVVALVSAVGDIADSHTLLYARTLARHGARVVIVRPGDPAAARSIEGVEVDVLPGVRFNFWLHKPGLLHLAGAVLGRLANSVRLVSRITSLRPDVVVATEPDAWLAALISRVLGRHHRVVADLREIYEDRAIAFPRLLAAPVFAGVKRLQVALAQRTDGIIHMSPERRDYFEYLGRVGTVVQYAPELRDSAWESDRVSVHLRRSPDELVVVHAGSLRHNYACDTLIRAFARLERDGVPVRLLVLGGTAGRIEAAEELAELVRCGSIEIRPNVSFAEVVAVLRGADIGVNLVLPIDTMHRLAQPRKVFEYFAAGLSVVVADVPTLRTIVGTHDLGEIVDPWDPDAVAAGIARLVADPVRRRACAARARAYAEREGSWERQEPMFLSAVLGND